MVRGFVLKIGRFTLVHTGSMARPIQHLVRVDHKAESQLYWFDKLVGANF
jgi:hypothetical protein